MTHRKEFAKFSCPLFFYLAYLNLANMTNEEFIASIKLDGEEWETTTVCSRYAVSNLGRVLAYSAPYVCGNKVCKREPQLIKPRYSKGTPGYLRVVLSDGNRGRRCYAVHRLVAMAFIPNPNNFPEIDHINRNSLDNRVENLMWCTHHMNMMNEETRKHSIAMRIGKKRPSQWKPVVRIKNGIATKIYDNIISAGEDGFSITTVGKVCRGIGKSCGGYQWAYLEDYEKSISVANSSAQSSETDGIGIEGPV